MSNVYESLNKFLKEIKQNLRELDFIIDHEETKLMKIYIVTMIFKGIEYKCEDGLEIQYTKSSGRIIVDGDEIQNQHLNEVVTQKIKKFYDKAKRIDNILISIKNEVLRFFSKFFDNLPKDIAIIPSTTYDESVYEVLINIEGIGITITIKFYYDKNKLELYNFSIEPTTVKGEKIAHELLEGIISYLLVKKLFS